MTNYWVFVVVDHKGRDADNAATIFENRVKKKFWALNPRTAYAKKVQKGDNAVLCLAGKYCRGFAGSAIVATGIQDIPAALKKDIRGWPSKGLTHCVRFTSVRPFKQIRCLADYIGKVSFLKQGRNPRLPQGSIIKINKSEYNRLTRSD